MTERSAALGLGTLAAIVAALPAVPRVGEQGANAALAFLSLTGGTALVLGPLLIVVGTVRPGPATRATLVGLALAATPLAFLAEGLKLNTHHRPLGAATFAVLALATIAAAVALSFLLLRFSESAAPTTNRVVSGCLALVALASVGLVLARALGSPSLVPHVLDGLRALATATLAHLLLRLPRVVGLARRAGGPLWIFAVVAGLLTFRVGGGSTPVAVRAAAPVLGGPPAWF